MKQQNMTTPSNQVEDADSRVRIWVDADACPKPVKEVLFRLAKRGRAKLTFVANQKLHLPGSEWIEQILVRTGMDLADKKIVELARAGDIVISADIPLAAALVKNHVLVIGPRGELLDDDSIHSRLATRNLMDQLRMEGEVRSGPRPYGPKDIQAFSNQLDKMVTRLSRGK